MTTAEWVEPLLRGLGALGLAALSFGAARLRFPRRGGHGAPADLGLD